MSSWDLGYIKQGLMSSRDLEFIKQEFRVCQVGFKVCQISVYCMSNRVQGMSNRFLWFMKYHIIQSMRLIIICVVGVSCICCSLFICSCCLCNFNFSCLFRVDRVVYTNYKPYLFLYKEKKEIKLTSTHVADVKDVEYRWLKGVEFYNKIH